MEVYCSTGQIPQLAVVPMEEEEEEEEEEEVEEEEEESPNVLHTDRCTRCVYISKPSKENQRTSFKHAGHKNTKPRRKKGRLGVLNRHSSLTAQQIPLQTRIRIHEINLQFLSKIYLKLYRINFSVHCTKRSIF